LYRLLIIFEDFKELRISSAPEKSVQLNGDGTCIQHRLHSMRCVKTPGSYDGNSKLDRDLNG
jgi:hypothetical protein